MNRLIGFSLLINPWCGCTDWLQYLVCVCVVSVFLSVSVDYYCTLKSTT